MLSTPRHEFPDFPAALSFTMVLGAEGTLAALERREERLAEDLDRIETGLITNAGTVPRVALIEDEYLRAITSAELDRVRSTIGDLRTGRLAWGDELEDEARAWLTGPVGAEVEAPAGTEVEAELSDPPGATGGAP